MIFDKPPPVHCLAAYPSRWQDITPELLDTLGMWGRIASGGIATLPVALGGGKAPVGKWQIYGKRPPNPLQVASWVHRGFGYAVFCGSASGNLEALDFDAAELYVPWYRQCFEIVERYDLPIIASPRGGHHIYWCSGFCGRSTKLAKSEFGETLIETKGEGGYILGPLNPRAVHKSGKLYLPVSNRTLPDVPTITVDERLHLLRAAASFDRFGLRKEAIRKQAQRLKAEQWRQNHLHQDTGFCVGDDFKAKASWPEVLEPHCWTYAGGTFWARPGASPGAHSAAVNEASDGTSLLTVFSSNAGALAPTLGAKATWDLFSAYAALNHGGDRVEAAKELRRKGYGG